MPARTANRSASAPSLTPAASAPATSPDKDSGQTGLPGRRATGLIARFGSLPFRQLAGPRPVLVAAEARGPHQYVTLEAAMTTTIPGERGQLTALRGAWLFDGTGPALIPDPVVVIEGSVIRDVCSGGRVPESLDGGTVIDLPGATLLPGLVDTHVHLAFDASADPVGNLARRGHDEVVAAMADAGRAALRGGVTTIRDLGDYRYLSLGLRGRADLPTVVAAGPPITTSGGHCHYLGGAAAPTCEGIRAAVREHASRGVDVVKIMASGGNLTPGSRQDLAQFPPEVLRAAVDEAHRLGLPVTAHAHAVAAIADAVAAGVDGLEHVSFWTEEGVDAPADLIRLIAARQIAVGATLGMVPVPGMTPPPAVAMRMPAMIANTRRLYEAGARDGRRHRCRHRPDQAARRGPARPADAPPAGIQPGRSAPHNHVSRGGRMRTWAP